jgi:hypothetical protein
MVSYTFFYVTVKNGCDAKKYVYLQQLHKKLLYNQELMATWL